MAVPYDVVTVGVAAALLYRLVREVAGSGGARVAMALLLASLAPTLSAAPLPPDVTLSAVATLSLLWWVPLLGGLLLSPHHRSAAATKVLAGWWALTAGVALMAPAPWAAIATRVETASAAALAAIAVVSLTEAATQVARRRPLLIATLTVTCLWQAWLVMGTGRPARVLVPMLAAALLIAATDVLTDDPADQPDRIRPALVIAMLVLGLVPGTNQLVAQQRVAAAIPHPSPATMAPDAETPSVIAAP